MFIAITIRIHIINVIKCNKNLYLSNTSALNEIKTLDYIIHELILFHNNTTNFANEIDLNTLNSSMASRGRDHSCGRDHSHDHDHGHGGFGKNMN